MHDSMWTASKKWRQCAPRSASKACNGNHEIYARAEDLPSALPAGGIKLLRSENAIINYKGGQLNLIGGDYQRYAAPAAASSGCGPIDFLVRRDKPNIFCRTIPTPSSSCGTRS